MKIFILAMLILLSNFGIAQSTGVTIHVDSKIELLVENQTNTTNMETNPLITGYRLQLFFDQDRTLVDEAKKDFLELQPDVPAYIEYNAPNYILKVGDFRSKLEAKQLQALMLERFSTCFVIKEKVYLPSITPVIQTTDK